MQLIGNMADGKRSSVGRGVFRVAQKVVLARNIGKYSQVLQQPGKGLSLQAGSMTDDDLAVAFAASGKLGSVLTEARTRRECEVTIYSGTNCKLCDVARGGELLGR